MKSSKFVVISSSIFFLFTIAIISKYNSAQKKSSFTLEKFNIPSSEFVMVDPEDVRIPPHGFAIVNPEDVKNVSSWV